MRRRRRAVYLRRAGYRRQLMPPCSGPERRITGELRRMPSTGSLMQDHLHRSDAQRHASGEKLPSVSVAETRDASMVWVIVATVCIGSFMGQLDASITQLVLPALEREFISSIAEVSWVAIMFLL